ncbi:MAG: hypothetical protein ACOY0T_18200 [Myxococcota bacterium]
MKRSWLALCAVLLAACKRGPGQAAPAASSSTSPMAVATVPSAAPIASGARPSTALPPEKQGLLERARAVVNAWDAALNQHDADRLTPLYAEMVSYYGRTLTRDKLVEQKRKALATTPDYTQTLSHLTLAADADGSVQVRFDKRSGSQKAQRSVPARLRLEKNGDSFRIAVESDAPSDARSDIGRPCEAVAMDVAMSLPRVKTLLESAGPDARQGALFYPEEVVGDVSASIGFHHDERFQVAFIVEVKEGNLSVLESGEALPIPSEARARVHAKCAPQPAQE